MTPLQTLSDPLALRGFEDGRERAPEYEYALAWSTPKTLFDRAAIRDTETYRPQEMLDGRAIVGAFFIVDNTTGQTVTVTVVGAVDGGGADAYVVEAEGAVFDITVATATKRGFYVSARAPTIGVQLSFGTAPTSGVVTVRGAVQHQVMLGRKA